MSTQQPDEQLWKIAKQRVAFKKNLFSYIITIDFLWGIWWFTIGKNQGFKGYPWPIWPMLGWGLGLAFHYFNAYNGDTEALAQKEYDKLKKEQEQN